MVRKKTEPARWHEAPLSLPLRELQTAPEPVAGCLECVRLDLLRASAVTETYVDHSLITDCNILLRMHGTGH
ncbi:hypothetical protein [Streptomyces sp. NPDC029003]|uniref:hypothetical protein n=1 Tax=Streptomyces sp. NPDC029003 TaxID=3155125 RepID=UPI0034117EF8